MKQIDLNNPTSLEPLIKFTETGAKSGCPFCTGRLIVSVSAGDRIIFLKGVHVGKEVVVSKEQGLSDDEFLVRFDSDPPDQLVRVHYRRNAFAHSPLGEMPKWLCKLSIDDLCAIDDSALDLAVRLAVAVEKNWSPNTLLPLIATVRQRRLPVQGPDLWPTLEAHGISNTLKREFCRKFDFAIEVLVSLVGRPAIQKRRVEAMSVGRYLTPGQEEYFGPSPGIASRGNPPNRSRPVST